MSSAHLEDQHFEVVPVNQVSVVRLQLLHLDALTLHLITHLKNNQDLIYPSGDSCDVM